MSHRSLARLLALLATTALIAVACGGATTTQPSPTAAATAAASGAATARPSAAPSVLTRPVEFVISTAPGGGSDIYARQWIATMQTEKAINTSVLPVNKEGGAGAVAFTYVFEKKGDPHYIMVTLNSFFTTIITTKGLPYQATDFTPLANMALDPFYLWANEDSKWKTAQDFINDAKTRSITVAGTGSKQEDEVLFRRIESMTGAKPFNYIPQSGGGAVAAALAGHQGGVEATVNNPSEGIGLFQANPRKMRPLCAFTPAAPTAPVYKDVPTCKAQGLDISDYYIVRAIVGPPGLSATQTTFWADVFKKVFDSNDWKKFMTDNGLDPDYRAGDALKKLFDDYNKLHIDIAKKNGWI
jgi:tripartite-type tricarboxylate transporter receptor subunit TctC